MSNELQQKIDELLDEAQEIDKKVVELINGATIEPISDDFDPDAYDLGIEPIVVYKFQSPSEDFDKLQRQIVQPYDRCSNATDTILSSFLLEKNSEFNELKIGILSILKFAQLYNETPKKRESIQTFNFELDAQKNILVGLSRTLHLIPAKKNVSRSTPAIVTPNQLGSTTIVANRDVNFNSQPVNIDVNIKHFEQLIALIQKSGETPEIKEKLLFQVEDLKKTQYTSTYSEALSKFMETAANSATIWSAIQPVSQFLFGLLPS